MGSEIHKKLSKLFGEAYRGSNAPSLECRSTGFLGLDLILGGGLPKGKVVELYGQKSTQKSFTTLTICGNIQRAGGRCAYIDLERTVIDNHLIRARVETNGESFHLLQGITDRDKVLEAIEFFCDEGMDLIVLDSVPYLTKEGGGIGDLARYTSTKQTALANYVGNSGATLVLINQLRTTGIGSYVTKQEGMGGAALNYLSSVQIRILSKAYDKKTDIQTLVYRTDKNKYSRDGQFTEIQFDRGLGVLCPYSSALQVLLKSDLLLIKGTWFNWQPKAIQLFNVDEKIGQGAQSVINFLKDNPEVYQRIYSYLLENYIGQLDADVELDSD